MPRSMEAQALTNALLICAHALRLNTTNATGEGPEWPTCPWSVMRQVHDLLSPVALEAPGICAALVILDESCDDPVVVDQESLMDRIKRLADV